MQPIGYVSDLRVNNQLSVRFRAVGSWSRVTAVRAQRNPEHLKTFVANRVVIIQECTEFNQWHHVPSEQNPADIISRGLDPEKIPQSDMWWFGPSFLKERVVNFPDECKDLRNSELYKRELKDNQWDSVHFTEDQFENHRADNRLLLKQTAVPSIFSHRLPQNSRKPSKYVLLKDSVKASFSVDFSMGDENVPDRLLEEDEITFSIDECSVNEAKKKSEILKES
ncbi:unnamed protein product [Larinioides sclopetarius]|uniref:Uncharacterized protein n=1 Tax=Larinioides sclopetarius TaxID=280406 RepID=A0AAV2B6M3_9ARAC